MEFKKGDKVRLIDITEAINKVDLKNPSELVYFSRVYTELTRLQIYTLETDCKEARYYNQVVDTYKTNKSDLYIRADFLTLAEPRNYRRAYNCCRYCRHSYLDHLEGDSTGITGEYYSCYLFNMGIDPDYICDCFKKEED